MSASTMTVGYPPHRLTEYSVRPHPDGIQQIWEWQAACGRTGTVIDAFEPWKPAGRARYLELCRRCFPLGGKALYDRPVQVTGPEHNEGGSP